MKALKKLWNRVFGKKLYWDSILEAERQFRPSPPTAPRVLSGIERMELEQEAQEMQALAKLVAEGREKTKARIVELETKLAPILAELNELRTRLNPSQGMANAFASGKLSGMAQMATDYWNFVPFGW